MLNAKAGLARARTTMRSAQTGRAQLLLVSVPKAKAVLTQACSRAQVVVEWTKD